MHCLYWKRISAAIGAFLTVLGGTSAVALSPLPQELVLRNPSVLEDLEPIDVVYTWVDGQDAKWKALRKKWVKKTKHVAKEAQRSIRFRSRDELKYSLRSINDFAPFVRHIFIVTSGQRPKWLADHPKITLVNHKEIFSNPKHLPTFNSIAIEANLHKIKGLANRYIYFNDDVFLGKNVTRHNFFVKPYKIKVFLANRRIFDNKHRFKTGLYRTVSRNMVRFLAKMPHYSVPKIVKNNVYYHAHTPFPMIKWIAEIAEQRFPEVFEACSSHKFRCSKDMSLTNGLIPQFAMMHSVGEPASSDLINFAFTGKKRSDAEKMKLLLEKRPMFFCVQDSADKASKAAEARLKRFFEKYFPNPAPWEKTEKNKK